MPDFEDLQLCNSIARLHERQREIIATLDRRLETLRRNHDAKSRERDQKVRALNAIDKSTSVPGVARRVMPGAATARTVIGAVSDAVNAADATHRHQEIERLTREIQTLDRQLRDLQSNIANADDYRKDAIAEKRRLEARYAELDCSGRILR